MFGTCEGGGGGDFLVKEDADEGDRTGGGAKEREPVDGLSDAEVAETDLGLAPAAR